VLELQGVSKSFREVSAVRDLTLSVEAGSVLGVLGPNGAGKTTTMRMLLGILMPDAGSIRWRGSPIDARLRRSFGYLPEERGLYGKMSVREHIVYFARLHGLSGAQAGRKAGAWIERLAIGEYATRPCAELSKGNQQKVQIACAAVHDPELLVLDEPFSGLDPVNADHVASILRQLNAAGVTLMLSSHQMWQVEHLCGRFCIIARGEKAAEGTLEELRRAWPTRVLRVGPRSEALEAALRRAVDARVVDGGEGIIACEVPSSLDLSEVLRRLAAEAPLTHFERVEPTLHEIYVGTVGSGA